MTIRSNKNYDQHAHDQQTQATGWAAESGDAHADALQSGGGYNPPNPAFAKYVPKRSRPEYSSYYAEQNREDVDQARRME
jgi:hypothetical protein